VIHDVDILINGTKALKFRDPNLIQVRPEIAVNDISGPESSTPSRHFRKVDKSLPDTLASAGLNVLKAYEPGAPDRAVLWMDDVVTLSENFPQRSPSPAPGQRLQFNNHVRLCLKHAPLGVRNHAARIARRTQRRDASGGDHRGQLKDRRIFQGLSPPAAKLAGHRAQHA